MTQSPQTSVDRTVDELPANQRDAIQNLIGANLSSEQRVFILAYQPGLEPTVSDKQSARSRIQELTRKAHQNSLRHGITESEADAAVNEACKAAKN
ncbi:MAG: hypothetical protein SGI77_25490 [Pirellulaceae bacterium]|nr:hypothetical protein [Pirellulaceae bacterium]